MNEVHEQPKFMKFERVRSVSSILSILISQTEGSMNGNLSMHIAANDLKRRLMSKNLDPLKQNNYFQAVLDGLHKSSFH